jgi:drug/metabolite transporter (DMT)-like permease
LTEERRAGRGPSRLRLYSLIALMVLLWSANFIVGKLALRWFPPLLLSPLRTTLAGLFIVPVYLWNRRANPEARADHWTRRDILLLVLLGIFGVALNQIFFIVGLSRTSVAHSSLVIGLTPMLVLLLAAGLRQERLTARKLAGMAVAIGGIGVLNAAPSKAAGATLAGDLFIFLAALTFALFTVAGKHATARHASITVNTFAYAGGAVALAPFTMWQSAGFSFDGLGAAAWLTLIYMALFPSLICYLIYYYALMHIPASRVSAFAYLQPLLATVMATTLLGERLTENVIGGGAMVLAGVWLTERG